MFCRFCILFLFLQFSSSFGSAQTFLNGSFETTSSFFGCNYNLSNASFNSLMPNVNAYGAGQELDIMVNGCYVVGIADGSFCVALAANPTDEIALALSTPLTMGNNYSFTFWSYSEISFRVQGDVEIGASTSSSSFGTLIFTAATVPDTWVQHTVVFTAPNATTHITVRNIAGDIHWNRVDGFQMFSTLPVELLSFNANAQENTVLLDWSTASEVNSDYFSVEKSSDGINFTEFSRVSSKGNSAVKNDYSTIDVSPLEGTSYYRLRQKDFDGGIKLSEVKTVNMHVFNEFEIYPNPGNSVITIRSKDLVNANVRIINSFGEIIQIPFADIDETSLDISNLPNGIYFISLNLNGKNLTKRFVKE
jgi:hypothetical protein